ncbi:MAG: hypothetical protein RMJ98_00210 [Myxococcales bacterium]|nr:hypothetical protein [Polyangiaceae bacterium]MDW8247709.1 hypothetical protein [Myxococcales bacterium]
MNLPRPTLPLTLIFLLGAACVPDVKELEVTASIEEASLSIKQSPFGTAEAPQGIPEGSFTLVLRLGEYASGSSEVAVQQFAVVDSSGGQTLLATLPIQADMKTSFRVEPGSSHRHAYTFAYDKPVPIGALCAAGQVRYTGTILDGARGKTTLVTSTPIPVSCP